MTHSRREFLARAGSVGLTTCAGLTWPGLIEQLAIAAAASGGDPGTSELYGRLAGTLVTADDREQQKSALGLFMTVGVAGRFSRGEIDAVEARRQIDVITRSGQIPDASALKAVTDALSGSKVLDPLMDRTLDESFKLLGMTAPLFSPAGGVTVTLASQYGAPIVRYLNDPDNVLTGQFAPPRPDPIRLAGAAAWAKLDQMVRDHGELADIYKRTVPQVSTRLRIGQPRELLAEALLGDFKGTLSPELKGLLINAMSAGRGDLPGALAKLEGGIYERLNALERTSKDVLEILRQQMKEQDRRRQLEEAAVREKFIQQEVTGAITIVDVLTRHVLGDPQAANTITGCLRAAQSTYQLVSGFIAGSIGVLGFAGGVATVFTGLLGLFGGVPDATLQRLDEIDRKLERLTKLLIEGFKHLDRRMTQLLQVSHDTLRLVVHQGAVQEGMLTGLDQQVDDLRDWVENAARGQIERPLNHLANQLRIQLVARRPLDPHALENLTTLATHANEDSRRPEMNGRLRNPSIRGVSDQLVRTGDIRTIIGNLPFVARHAGVPLPEDDLPDVTHWSRAVQGALELLVLVPAVHPDVVSNTLGEFWRGGNFLKAAVLAATSPDPMLSLLDRYEAWAVRGRSNAGIAPTADEVVEQLLVAELLPGKSHRQHVDDHLLLAQTHPLFELGTPLHFLLAVLAWRCSDTNDSHAVNPRAVDLMSNSSALAAYLNQLLDADPKRLETEAKSLEEEAKALEDDGKKAEAEAKRGAAEERKQEAEAWKKGIVETRNGGKRFVREQVQKTVMRALRDRLSGDIDRLRGNLPALAHSRRVRDVDEMLLGVHAVGRSRTTEGDKRLELPLPETPLLRVPPRALPQNVYQIDGGAFSREVARLCRAAGKDFVDEVGEVVDQKTGLCKLAQPPLGFRGVVRPTGAPGNTDGRRTCVRLFLPEPLNWTQAIDQSERYFAWLLNTFDRVRPFENLRLPLHARQTDAATTKQVSHRYLHRTPGPEDAPCELALVTRESAVDGGGVKFSLELWVFTGRSGSILQNVKVER